MSISNEINRRSVTAVKWSTLGTAVKFGLQLVAQIMLARLVGPENYGLFAMAMVVLTLTNLIADLGFTWGLIQCRELTEEDIRIAFTWQLILAFLIAFALFLLAPLIAAYLKQPQLESIVRWLSLGCVITAVSVPATLLLRRRLDFRALLTVQIASCFLAYIVIGVPLAYLGAGVWALVAAWVLQTLFASALLVIRHPHPLKPLIWHPGAARLSGIGLIGFLTNICNWALNNVDRIVLGRLIDAHAVGIYVTGHTLATTPNLMLAQTQPVFLAAGAKLQSETDRLRRAYLSVIATVWVIVAPMFAVLAIVAQDLVNLLYGPEWGAAGTVLAILAISMPAYATFGMSTPILWNTGRSHYEGALQLPILVIAVFAFYNWASQGVVVVAFTAAGVFVGRAIVVTAAACRQLGIRLGDLGPYFARAALMIVLACMGAYIGIDLGHISGATHAGAVVAGLLCGCVFPVVGSLLFPALLGTRVVEMLCRFSPSLCPGGRFLALRRRAHSTRSP
jgi:PST family polysaccharide transporter